MWDDQKWINSRCSIGSVSWLLSRNSLIRCMSENEPGFNVGYLIVCPDLAPVVYFNPSNIFVSILVSRLLFNQRSLQPMIWAKVPGLIVLMKIFCSTTLSLHLKVYCLEFHPVHNQIFCRQTTCIHQCKYKWDKAKAKILSHWLKRQNKNIWDPI